MKLAVIGGGSTYTPELADGISRLLPQVTEFVLVDPDPGRLGGGAGVGQPARRRGLTTGVQGREEVNCRVDER